MNDEPKKGALQKNLDERFARFPEMYERMQRIADQLEESLERGMSADEAEEVAIAQINELGKAWLSDWARAQHERSVAAVRKEIPRAIKQSKKN
jgi:Skp family chaperone for outer membrane proteins